MMGKTHDLNLSKYLGDCFIIAIPRVVAVVQASESVVLCTAASLLATWRHDMSGLRFVRSEHTFNISVFGMEVGKVRGQSAEKVCFESLVNSSLK